MKPTLISEMVNSAQTLEGREIKKVAALKMVSKATNLRFARRRGNMKTGTKDKLKGSFHELKGTIKEGLGKATSNPNLKAEGKAEKKAGKVQQRIGDAKEVVANLKGKLADLKKLDKPPAA
jgi:uncharacterized protein YjbJ (UPF0337 family)